MNQQEIIKKTIQILQEGGVILYPTDTIWGLGCDAQNEEAIAKIRTIKKRTEGKSFIILLDNENRLDNYIKEIPEIAWSLIEYAENPLTIIFPNAKNLPASVIHDDGSVAIRIVKSGFTHELIKKFRKPILSTSANISGNPSPKTYQEIDENILKQVDFICELSDTGTKKPSTIMRLELNGQFSFIRR